MNTLSTAFRDTPRGRITLLTLTNASGARIVLSTLGAGILEVHVPDRDGTLGDVALGYADPADYICDGSCMGKCPGRYANRIARGHLTVEGREYQLETNNGPNALHGGPEGFQNRIWNIDSASGNTVVMSLHSPDGDANYPGALDVRATFTWTDDCRLGIELRAECDAATVVNLTNHTYWNLRGHDSGSVLDHTLRLFATHYLPTDETLIPDGTIAPVAGTPMDFTAPHRLGERIRDDFPALRNGKGYDSCWVASPRPGKCDNSHDSCREANPTGCDTVRPVAVLHDETTGRTLTVSSDQPGVQVYTGNWLAGGPASKSGRAYSDYDGVAIECQDFPDAPNHPDFPSTLIRPAQPYLRHITFHFTTP